MNKRGMIFKLVGLVFLIVAAILINIHIASLIPLIMKALTWYDWVIYMIGLVIYYIGFYIDKKS